MLKIAVIGFGYWGPNLARNWNQTPKAELKYICDIKPDRLLAAKTNYPYVNTVEDYFDVLNDETIDAVNIATPIKTHYEIAKNALLAGKHVLVEKPLTASSIEMEELISLAQKTQKTLMVGHTFLFSPPVLKVKEYINANKLGDLDFIQLTRINLGRVKHDYNVIWDLAPHDFSILEYWLGKMPESIQVVGKASTFEGVCDVAFINLRYPNDILVNVHLSWISPIKLRQSYIVGKKEMVIYDDTHPTEKVKLFDMGVDVVENPRTFGEFQLTYRTGDIHVPKLKNAEPLRDEVEHFVECIENNSMPRTSPEHALRIIKMIEAAQESLRRGGEIVFINN